MLKNSTKLSHFTDCQSLKCAFPQIQIISKDSEFFPKSLLVLPDCPEILFVIGNKKILNNFSISIVGTRNSSAFANEIAYNFSKELSLNNITIVSGMATGIDTQAHLGANQDLKSIQNHTVSQNSNEVIKGTTIAIIACGFNHIFASKNISLINSILNSNGAIITEYFPDTPPQKFTFINRNRLIAAISNAIIVIEAPIKSGSLNTAQTAITLNKPVFAIPWNINLTRGQGCNKLIEKGANILINPLQILEYFNINVSKYSNSKFNTSASNHVSKQKLSTCLSRTIPQNFIELYNYISKNQPVNKNKIYSDFKYANISSLNSNLTLMELQSFIQIKRKSILHLLIILNQKFSYINNAFE